MIKKVTLFFLLFLCQFAKAQPSVFAKKIIDTLTSNYFAGRGYVENGDAKAAKFILKEFKKIKLKKFSHTYSQNFSFPVNTFPEKIELIFDKDTLQAGIDFIVSPSSPSLQFNGETVVVNDSLFKSSQFIDQLFSGKYYKKALLFNVEPSKELNTVVDEIQSIKYKPSLIITQAKKLTWSVSTNVNIVPEIQIKETDKYVNPQNVIATIDNQFITKHKTKNIIAYIKGKTLPDSFIVFTAHYDHLGKMGNKTIFPGANDNASGVAMLLSLANYYAKPENKPNYSIVFIAFAGEEAGLIGSKYYTENSFFSLEKIKFLINLDLMGTGEKGITVVNATEFTSAFKTLEQINTEKKYVPEIKKRGKAANSDHYWFTEKKVPSFFIYANGDRMAYHDIYDISHTLPLNNFDTLFNLLLDFSKQIR